MNNTNSRNRNQRGAAQSQRSRQKNNNDRNYGLLLIGGLVIIILVFLIFLVNRNKDTVPGETGTGNPEETGETVDNSKLMVDHIIDMSGIPGFSSNAKLTLSPGMDREDVLKAAHKLYEWDMVLVNEDAMVGNVVKPTVDQNVETETGSGDSDTENADASKEIAALTEITVEKSIKVPDIIEMQLKTLLDTVFAEDAKLYSERKSVKKQKKTEAEAESTGEELSIYIMELDGVSELIDEMVRDADDMWYVEPKGGSIERYDAENDSFIMEGSSDGYEVKTEKLAEDLKAAFDKGTYRCSIPVSTDVLPAESAVKNGDYKVIASYVTKTTSNSVRNKNIQLACETLNGTIIRPGEEFSYNQVIGQRTEERGFGAAAAYANGEVVQEVGGGVCQLSSTLYNAITEAGLKTTYRSPHTFKPTYVSPGQDATVSWGGPDYRFANVIALPDISYDTTYAIGIKAHYQDQTVTVEIYGRPVFKPGYSVTMESEMTGETEVVRVLITPEMAAEGKTPTTGDQGSHWKTYLHIKKDGNTVSRDIYHTTSYKGHTEYYTDETLAESTSETGESVSETETEPYTGPIGPGMPQSTTQNSPQNPTQSNEQNTPQNPTQNSQQTTKENPGPGHDSGNASPAESAVSPGGGNSSSSGGGVNIVDAPGNGPGSGQDSGMSPGDPGFIIQEGP